MIYITTLNLIASSQTVIKQFSEALHNEDDAFKYQINLTIMLLSTNLLLFNLSLKSITFYLWKILVFLD